MIEISNVCKKLSDKDILKNVEINVSSGSILGLIGPNGAGKTTLIKCLTGIYKVDNGSIKIDGEDIWENKLLKASMGYVADQNNYYSNFRVRDMIKFYELTYETFNLERYNKLNNIFKIPEKKFIRELSKGMKMRFSIMLNLSVMPKYLIMDEPTSGLDPIAKREVLNILMADAAERGTTVFISSHNLSDLERICDSIAIINNGEVKYVNSVENMKKNIRKIQVVFNGNPPEDIENWNEVMDVKTIGRVYYIVTKEYTEELNKKLVSSGCDFIEEVDLSLEDMFIYSMGGDVDYEEIFK